MRHDAKLGLALGMLVIGFAVAFCFPRQPEPSAWERPEIPAPIADSKLEFLPIRAYQPVPASAAQPSVPVVESSTAPAALSALPITLEGTPLAPAPISSLAPLASAEAATASSIAKTTTNAAPPAPSVPETYQVRAGDTLSGIAGRCLGSTARYLELYEANKELLSSPNDLKIGMELKIPRPADETSTSSAIAESETVPWKGIAPANSTGFGSSSLQIQQPPTAPWLADRPQERN